MKIYTDKEYQQQYDASLEYEEITQNVRGFNEVGCHKSQWTNTQYSFLCLGEGIEVNFFEEEIYLDHNCLVEHDDRQCLTAKFYFQGNHGVISPDVQGVSAQYREVGGQHYLFYLPNMEEVEQCWAGDYLKMLRIQVDLQVIRKFITELNDIPVLLTSLIESDNPKRFHHNVGKITPEMKTIARQICYHPYQGAIARMYLEAKVWELLAMQLNQLGDSTPLKSSLKPQTLDCIYEAREILLSELENPPSISQLSQQVGVCQRTLRRGFKELFGTTVIGYLNQKRMEKAQQLLRQKQLSVSEVANIVGYSHFGHFSTAFKNQFGITPSQCLAGEKII
ncbi:MAG: AraC family transcriptional regulator [Geminocystis sp.]